MTRESAYSPSAAQAIAMMDAGFVHQLSATAGVWMAEWGTEAKTDSSPEHRQLYLPPPFKNPSIISPIRNEFRDS